MLNFKPTFSLSSSLSLRGSLVLLRFLPLEKEMATHSSILAWRIPWTEELGGLQYTGLQRVGDTTERLHFHQEVLPLTLLVGMQTSTATMENSVEIP